jgi:uncharacterized protein (TIGR02246 family)
MAVDRETAAAVKDIVASYAKAFASRDLDGMLELFAADSEVIHIGTGKDEWGKGQTAIKKLFQRNFAQSEGVYFTFGKMTLGAEGTVAWVAAPYIASTDTREGRRVMDGRLSLVLNRPSEKWQIRQLHISHPDVRQREGQSFPTE